MTKKLETTNDATLKSLKDIFASRKEVAEELGCSISYVDNLRRSGFLKSYRIGGLVRFKRSEIVEAITEAQKSIL